MPRFQGVARGLARLVLAQLFINACVTGMRVAGPLQSLRLGHSEAAVGCLIALFALSQLFLALPAGRYCDCHGLKRPIAMSAVAAMAAGAIASAWPVFPALCASALLMGGAGGVAIIAVQRHVRRIAGDPAALRRAFSWLAIGLALSNVLGPLMALLGLTPLPLLAWLAVRGTADRALMPPTARKPAAASSTFGATPACAGCSW